ncbi:MAG TPA: 2-hydroxychromene-2-carboxylate isomerase [Stellaceae bacterium]|jgi:2-hydroxychromene-2-carboxylate isomerase|nr:2-hydroxychromene-2-carboxylate isomerase [Stellaceae bacterium]
MNLEFLYDFGSPNTYLAHRIIPGIEARTGAKFRYVPILLGGVFKATNNKSPVVQFADIKNKLAYDRLEVARFIEKHGLTQFRMNPNFPVNTLAIMRGAVAAEMEGVAVPYIEAMFRGMWEEGHKLDDPAVIVTTLTEAGLDADRLTAAAQSQPVKDRLLANTEAAVARGTFGAPTFFVGDEIYFGKDRLAQVEEAIATK